MSDIDNLRERLNVIERATSAARMYVSDIKGEIDDLRADRDEWAAKAEDLSAQLRAATSEPDAVTWERSSPEEVPPLYPGCWVRLSR